MKPILQNTILIGIGYMLSLLVETTLFATLWVGLLVVVIFCTTKLCQFFDYQCPVTDSCPTTTKKQKDILTMLDKSE